LPIRRACWLLEAEGQLEGVLASAARFRLQPEAEPWWWRCSGPRGEVAAVGPALLSVKGKPVSSLTLPVEQEIESRFHSVVAAVVGALARSNPRDSPGWKRAAHTDLKAIQVAQDINWLTGSSGGVSRAGTASLEQLHKAEVVRRHGHIAWVLMALCASSRRGPAHQMHQMSRNLLAL